MEILDNKQLIAILKKRRGEIPVAQFQKQVKVVSTQFLAKVLTGEYYIGPKIAKFLGYEQVVRFVKIPAKHKAKAKARKVGPKKGQFRVVKKGKAIESPTTHAGTVAKAAAAK
jgi:hypothetical protein